MNNIMNYRSVLEYAKSQLAEVQAIKQNLANNRRLKCPKSKGGVNKPILCPACLNKRFHSKDEWKRFHPLAGHGFNREQKWTSEEAKRLSDIEHEELRKVRGKE